LSLIDVGAGIAGTALMGWLGWSARQYVLSVKQGPQGPQGNQGNQGPQGLTNFNPIDMTVRQLELFADMLATRMNGRYLGTKDALLKFSELERKIDAIHLELRDLYIKRNECEDRDRDRP
jgi:hypothetical protein